MEVLAAIIGGLFSLAGIYLNHLLSKDRNHKTRDTNEDASVVESETVSRTHGIQRTATKQERTRFVNKYLLVRDKIKKGAAWFFGAWIILIIVASMEEGKSLPKPWDAVFAFSFTAILVYSIYLLISGLFSRSKP